MPDHPHIAIFDRKSDGPLFLNYLPVEEPIGLYGPIGDTFTEEDFAKLDVLAEKLLRTRPASGEVDLETVNAYFHRGPDGGCDYRIGNHVFQSDWRRLGSLDEAIAVVDKWLDDCSRKPASSSLPEPFVP